MSKRVLWLLAVVVLVLAGCGGAADEGDSGVHRARGGDRLGRRVGDVAVEERDPHFTAARWLYIFHRASTSFCAAATSAFASSPSPLRS